MANKQEPKFGATAKKQHAVFPVRVAVVVKLNCTVIKEDGGSLFKGDSMFLLVSLGFCRIPFELYLSHNYSVTTLSADVNWLF